MNRKRKNGDRHSPGYSSSSTCSSDKKMLLLRPDVYATMVDHMAAIERGDVPAKAEVFDRSLNVIAHYQRINYTRPACIKRPIPGHSYKHGDTVKQKKTSKSLDTECKTCEKKKSVGGKLTELEHTPETISTLNSNTEISSSYNHGQHSLPVKTIYVNEAWEDQIPCSMVTNTNRTDASDLTNSLRSVISASARVPGSLAIGDKHIRKQIMKDGNTISASESSALEGRKMSGDVASSGNASTPTDRSDFETSQERLVFGRTFDHSFPPWVKDFVQRELAQKPSCLFVDGVDVKGVFEMVSCSERVELMLRIALELLELWEAFMLLESTSNRDSKVLAFRVTRSIILSNEYADIISWVDSYNPNYSLDHFDKRLQQLQIPPAVNRLIVKHVAHILGLKEYGVNISPYEKYMQKPKLWAAIRELCLIYGFCQAHAEKMYTAYNIDTIESLWKRYEDDPSSIHLNILQKYGIECWYANVETNRKNDRRGFKICEHIFSCGWSCVQDQENDLNVLKTLFLKLRTLKFGEIKLCEKKDHMYRNALKVIVHVLRCENGSVTDEFVRKWNALTEVKKKCTVLLTHSGLRPPFLKLSRIITLVNIPSDSKRTTCRVVDLTLCITSRDDSEAKDVFRTVSDFYSPPVQQVKNAVLHLSDEYEKVNDNTSPQIGAIGYFRMARGTE